MGILQWKMLFDSWVPWNFIQACTDWGNEYMKCEYVTPTWKTESSRKRLKKSISLASGGIWVVAPGGGPVKVGLVKSVKGELLQVAVLLAPTLSTGLLPALSSSLSDESQWVRSAVSTDDTEMSLTSPFSWEQRYLLIENLQFRHQRNHQQSC